MDFFRFVFNCIFNFIELLDSVSIVSGFSALDFILCSVLFGFVIRVLLKRSSD